MDFGKLKAFREWLDSEFDHALVLSDSDPNLSHIISSVGELALIKVVPDCSCEGLAALFFKRLSEILMDIEGPRVSVLSLTVYEDEKNSATVLI